MGSASGERLEGAAAVAAVAAAAAGFAARSPEVLRGKRIWKTHAGGWVESERRGATHLHGAVSGNDSKGNQKSTPKITRVNRTSNVWHGRLAGDAIA